MSFWCLIVLFCVCAATLADQAHLNVEQYIADKRPDINPRWRPHYHIAPPVGWMNDPNGFIYYKDKYHIFYQFDPYDIQWGPMHWGHSTSSNLVDWETQPTALLPEKEMCFSGSAVVNGDTMVLVYTGQVNIIQQPFFKQSQYIAFSNDGLNFTKYAGNPVISAAPNRSPDFRDPKAWKNGDTWYVIIGNSNQNRGRALLYRSKNLVRWEFLRVLAEADEHLGHMWECPDFFELGGKHILLICPSQSQNGYIIGSFSYETFEFVQETKYQELDFGHDFYATHSTEKDGKLYIVAWFSMWGKRYPEADDGWVGQMTIFRELVLNGDRILQKPVDGMLNLRDKKIFDGLLDENQVVQFGQTGEIIINGDLRKAIVIVIEGRNGGGDQAILSWDPQVRQLTVDRRDGDPKQMEWFPINSQSWRLFLDACSLELFCGEGEVVFSSRVYPDGEWNLFNRSPQTLSVEAFSLKRSVPL